MSITTGTIPAATSPRGSSAPAPFTGSLIAFPTQVRRRLPVTETQVKLRDLTLGRRLECGRHCGGCETCTRKAIADLRATLGGAR